MIDRSFVNKMTCMCFQRKKRKMNIHIASDNCFYGSNFIFLPRIPWISIFVKLCTLIMFITIFLESFDVFAIFSILLFIWVHVRHVWKIYIVALFHTKPYLSITGIAISQSASKPLDLQGFVGIFPFWCITFHFSTFTSFFFYLCLVGNFFFHVLNCRCTSTCRGQL